MCCALKAERPQEPGVFRGTPCCPGVVEGVIRVVKAIEETKVCACVRVPSR